MRILIAEDDENSRVYLERALKSQGNQVTVVENGIAALAAMAQTTPEMIISDIMMPEMDGFELCRKVKSDPALKTVPFVFYTATYLDPRDKALGMKLGASRYLVKPMALSDLFEILKEVFEEHKAGMVELPEVVPGKESAIDEEYQNVLARKLEQKVHELEESREILQKTQEIAHIGSWFLDIKQNQLYWSDEVYRIFGVKPQEFAATYEAFLNFVHPDDRSMVIKAYDDAVENHTPYDIIHRIVRRDGEVRTVHEKSVDIVDESGKTIKSYGMVHDITERRLVEEELEKHHKHLEELVTERTTELEAKIAEIERFNKLFVDREFRIKELREKVKELERKLNGTQNSGVR
jgi:PAS domain S-box-containing protein